jgi:hypothetical protein
MILHIPIWVVFVIISIGAIIFASTRESHTDYDFITPVISFGIIVMVIIFWVAYFLGKFIK